MSKGLLDKLPPKIDKQGWPWDQEVDPDLYINQPQWPKISLITPSFNHARYLEQTIRSVLLQNYPNLEYFIIDGGSTDGTLEILEKYDPWITNWVSEPDSGQSSALNKGLKMITGDWANWINSDDYLLGKALYFLGDFALNNPEVSMIMGNSDLEYPGIRTDHYESEHFDQVEFIKRISIHQPCTYWKTDVLSDRPLLDESLNFCMDYDFWMHFVFDIQIGYLSKTLTSFRRYPEAKSSNFEDQSNIYFEQRKVASRFFLSCIPESVPYLKALGLYNNAEGYEYPIQKEFPNDLKDRMVNSFVYNCALQEYSMGHRKETNRILRASLKKGFSRDSVLLFLKNNIGIKKQNRYNSKQRNG